MTFKQIVRGIEALALVAALVFVVLLFANDGGGGEAAPASGGAQLYSANCAGCHGVDGGGGLGPALAGEVTTAFPDIEDQITLVSEGRGSMPAFGGDLSEEQLRQLVEYTRTDLGS